MNWWPFRSKCIEDKEAMHNQIQRLNEDIKGYKCALELQLREIGELKAVYNYQVSMLEARIKELTENKKVRDMKVRKPINEAV